MNWGAMTPKELLSYAETALSTDLERALFARAKETILLEMRVEELEDDSEAICAETKRAETERDELEATLERVRDALDEHDTDEERVAAIRTAVE